MMYSLRTAIGYVHIGDRKQLCQLWIWGVGTSGSQFWLLYSYQAMLTLENQTLKEKEKGEKKKKRERAVAYSADEILCFQEY